MQIILFFFSLLFIPEHDVPLANFNLYLEDNQLSLQVEFDKRDLALAIEQSGQRLSTASVQAYFLRHSKWLIDEKEQEAHFCSSYSDREHYYLEVEFNFTNKNPTSLGIHNTCLINTIPSHSNVIYLFQNGKQRGFRLHKDRQKTSIRLDQ